MVSPSPTFHFWVSLYDIGIARYPPRLSVNSTLNEGSLETLPLGCYFQTIPIQTKQKGQIDSVRYPLGESLMYLLCPLWKTLLMTLLLSLYKEPWMLSVLTPKPQASLGGHPFLKKPTTPAYWPSPSSLSQRTQTLGLPCLKFPLCHHTAGNQLITDITSAKLAKRHSF